MEGIEIDLVKLGALGKSEDEQQREITADIATFIPQLEELLGSGQFKPMDYEIVGDIVFKGVLWMSTITGREVQQRLWCK